MTCEYIVIDEAQGPNRLAFRMLGRGRRLTSSHPSEVTVQPNRDSSLSSSASCSLTSTLHVSSKVVCSASEPVAEHDGVTQSYAPSQAHDCERNCAHRAGKLLLSAQC